MNHITKPNPTFRSALCLVGLSLSLLIPSLWVPQKYLGLVGVVIYIAVASLALFILWRHVFRIIVDTVTEQQVLWMSAATFCLLLIAFLVLYPIAKSGRFGPGSDRDDALNLATTALLEGRYPYYARTYLGHPITPLPGSLVLAVPFVLLGNSAYQNLFWLAAFFCTMNSYLKDRRSSLLLLWTILALSPVVLHELVTGGDLLANSIFVLLSILWVVTVSGQRKRSSWIASLLAVFLGVAFASRLNFVLLLPLVASALTRSVGWKAAVKYCAFTCLTLGLLTVPFYLADPQGFSPLHTVNKLGQFQGILPFAGIVVPVGTGAIALLLSFHRRNSSIDGLLANCCVVLAVPVLCGTMLQCIKAQGLEFIFTEFGMAFLLFGAAAFWPTVFKSARGEEVGA